MTAYIFLGLLLGAPLILGMIFRVSASHLFFSLLASELLVRYFGDDAQLFADSFLSGSVAQFAELGLLIVPVLLTAFLMHGGISKSKVIFHIVPYAITGVVFAAFAADLLPQSVQDQIFSTPAGGKLHDNTDIIIGITVLLQLITLWLLDRSSHGKKHKKH